MRNLSIDPAGDVTTLTFDRPILSQTTLSELTDTLASLAASDAPPPIVLASAHPTIFLAGAHLGEIAALDQRSCIAYAELGRSIADRLASHPAAVVAAVHGSCSGGGFDLTMACDAIVASPEATFSHPGVRRGLVTGWGGSAGLDSVLGSPVLRRALLEGSELDAATMEELGAIHAIASDPRAQARATARRLSLLHPSRLASWRLLRRSRFVDRFRAFVVEKS